MTEQNRIDWLRLARSQNVGPVTFYRLLARYKTAGKALEALPELAKKGGRKLVPCSEKQAEAELKTLSRMGGQIICAFEESYPLALSAIEDAPPVLSVLGAPNLINTQGVAIVGARNASLNGRKLAHKFAHELGQAGQIVISGLARGIDTAAHEGALETGTVAVVAGGLDHIYPKENTELFKAISKQGAVLAENALGTQPTAQHFPRRNRIVSGLSSGVVVVEATKKSGSLITARLAAEQGRDVFAVPGFPLDPRAAGPNSLIKDGAIMVETVNDILTQTATIKHKKPVPEHFSEVQDAFEMMPEEPPETLRASVLSNLSHLPVGVDELARTCHVSIAGVQNVLLELELAGRLQRLPGNRVNLIEA